jgi:hypothetical protein
MKATAGKACRYAFPDRVWERAENATISKFDIDIIQRQFNVKGSDFQRIIHIFRFILFPYSRVIFKKDSRADARFRKILILKIFPKSCVRPGIRHSEERTGLSGNPDFGHSFFQNFTKITKKQIADSSPEARQDTGESVQRVFQQI